MVGPLPPPIHGQSFAFQTLVKYLPFENTKVINQNFTGKNKFIKIILFFFSILKEFIIIKFFKPDIIYFTCSRSKSGFLKDKILISLLAKKKDSVIIAHLHGADFKMFYQNASSKLKKQINKVYANVDVGIVLVNKMKEQFKNILPQERIRVVGNFYDNRINIYNNDILNKINSQVSIVKLIYFSNIMQTKGIFYLLEVYKQLKQNKFSVQLEIAGDFVGDDELNREKVKEKFFDLIKKYPNIVYKRVLCGEEKYQFLVKGDIFILPTYYKTEAFPISILEAMATGNAIITTNHNYLSDIVITSCGFTIEPKSTDALYDTIVSLIKNREKLKEIQLNNYHFAREKYSQENYIESIGNILKESYNLKKASNDMF